jgi:1,2-diacylglycerol 3-beta-glucosyltransferase
MLLLGLPLLLLAVVVALPALADFLMALRGLGRARQLPSPQVPQPLVYLVPAHDEEMLIGRAVRSLLGQDYPRELLTVAVIADNCTDQTAELAREAGAMVLERQSETERGKGHAIAWALRTLPLQRWAAVVIVDADTILDPGYSAELMRFAPLEHKAVQSFDGMSNEFENWLTRLAGLLTRSRYGIAMQLKVRAGLNVPLTGDGTVLGTALLREEPWRVETITEGWELYARYTLRGRKIHYAGGAKLYAQETRSLRQSRTQRERWTAGRFAVLRLYWRQILGSGKCSWLERLDLLAELSHPGPVMRGWLGLVGAAGTLTLQPWGWPVSAGLFATGVLQPVLYAALALRDHPQPAATLGALARLPAYALWRGVVGVRAALVSGRGAWTRTARHAEKLDGPLS